MRRVDRGTLRAAGFVALVTVTLVAVTATAASAADGSGGADQSGGLLAPLNVQTSEGVPLSAYQLNADPGLTDVAGQTQSMLLGAGFTLVRLVAGLSCWLVDFAFRFPLLTMLMKPAQQIADAYNTHVVEALGLKTLLLGWAFVFGLVLFMRGKVGKGLGEIILTLLIAALAASAFIRPDYLLGPGGPLNQSHQAALEVAEVASDAHGGDKASDGKDVTRGLQNSLTTSLVVKPYQLLEYGRVLDPASGPDKKAYDDHLKWLKGGYSPDSRCDKYPKNTRDVCASSFKGFDGFTDDLDDDGTVGRSAASYAKKATWDRVSAVLLLLIAVAAIALMVSAMCLVLLGTQAGAAGAAAVGGIAWVWAMLPGPSRMAAWRWLGVYVVAIMVQFVVAMALPMFGIAVDAVFSHSGPTALVERLLLLDALALSFLAFHRRMTAATSQFGQRLALRMRYAKVGGTHLPGDTSELGAALAMHAPLGGGQGLLGGPSGVHGRLLDRNRLLGHAAAMADGTGMPIDPGRLLGSAAAEARRGLAPLGLAAAGTRLGLKGAYWGLIGPKPAQEDESVKLLRTIAKGMGGPDGDGTGAGGGPGAGAGPGGGVRVNEKTGEILHDPDRDRELLGSRFHARASRVRAYRIGSRVARAGYGATLGLPRAMQGARAQGSAFTQDARQQLQVSANQVRQDANAWGGLAAKPIHGAARAWSASEPAVRKAAREGAALAARPALQVATAWAVNEPDLRKAARDSAVGASLLLSPLTRAEKPAEPTSETRVESIDSVNRRTVFDALMRLQRRTWDQTPDWGGDDE